MTKVWFLLANFAALCTIFGVSLSNLLAHSYLSWVSFIALLLCLGFTTWRIYLVSQSLIGKTYPRGYAPIATYATYSTKDGERYSYQVFRHIQIKKPWKSSIAHHFFWTGSKDPRITTQGHTCSNIRKFTNEEGRELSEIEIKFSKPRLYNEPEVVHIAMELDDTDEIAQPFLIQKVDIPIQLINFRVELHHAPPAYNNSYAVLKRRPIDKSLAEFTDELATVPFDVNNRSYIYHLIAPEPGFEYMLTWDKPPRRRRTKSKTKPAHSARK